MIACATVQEDLLCSKEVARLGDQLCRLVAERGVVHVGRCPASDLLRRLGWNGVQRFAASHDLDVRCRARGTAFDFTLHKAAA